MESWLNGSFQGSAAQCERKKISFESSMGQGLWAWINDRGKTAVKEYIALLDEAHVAVVSF